LQENTIDFKPLSVHFFTSEALEVVMVLEEMLEAEFLKIVTD
jgi:hypothetical protein